MTGVSWQRLRVPLLERLALADMAQRRGESEEAVLARIIRDAVRAECQAAPQLGGDRPQEEAPCAKP